MDSSKTMFPQHSLNFKFKCFGFSSAIITVTMTSSVLSQHVWPCKRPREWRLVNAMKEDATLSRWHSVKTLFSTLILNPSDSPATLNEHLPGWHASAWLRTNSVWENSVTELVCQQAHVVCPTSNKFLFLAQNCFHQNWLRGLWFPWVISTPLLDLPGCGSNPPPQFLAPGLTTLQFCVIPHISGVPNWPRGHHFKFSVRPTSNKFLAQFKIDWSSIAVIQLFLTPSRMSTN